MVGVECRPGCRAVGVSSAGTEQMRSYSAFDLGQASACSHVKPGFSSQPDSGSER